MTRRTLFRNLLFLPTAIIDRPAQPKTLTATIHVDAEKVAELVMDKMIKNIQRSVNVQNREV